MRRKPLTYGVFGLMTFVVLGVIGVMLLADRALREDLELIGFDWAMHLEARIIETVAPAIVDGQVKRSKLPPDEAFTDLVESVLIVGHIDQVDLVNAECLCEVSVRRVDGGSGPDRTEKHVRVADHPVFGLAAGSFRATASQHKAHKVMPQGSLKPGFVPVDRAEVRRVLDSGKPQTVILTGQNGARSALVYYPVAVAGETLYLLRVVVGLQAIYERHLSRAYFETTLLVTLLAVCLWLPARAYARADDIAARARQKLLDQMRFDGLTGALARAAFHEEGAAALARLGAAAGQALVLVGDLDRFKDINDFHGHPAGDAVLRAVVAHLRDVLGAEALVSRLGGDEFAAILPLNGVERQEGLRALGLSSEVLPPRLCEPPPVSLPDLDTTLSVGLSIGVARFPEDGEALSVLLKAADLALYGAKADGGGVARHFSAAMQASHARRVALLSQFRRPETLEQLTAAYQPVVEFGTGRIAGFEALVRWHHPDGSPRAAGAFADVMDDPGLAREITAIVLRRIVADRAAWAQAGFRAPPIGINVQEVDLLPTDFLDAVAGYLGTRQLAPGDLVIEVTENCLFGRNRDRMISRIRALKKLGCLIALDDFGAGHTSISQLRDVPRDTVKIDKRFIGSIHTNKDDAAIVSAVVGLSQTLGIKVLAEGVETQAQAAVLHALGCHMAQGFLYAPATPAAEVPDLIARFGTGPARVALSG